MSLIRLLGRRRHSCAVAVNPWRGSTVCLLLEQSPAPDVCYSQTEIESLVGLRLLAGKVCFDVLFIKFLHVIIHKESSVNTVGEE